MMDNMLLLVLFFISFALFPGISNVASNRVDFCSSNLEHSNSEIFRCHNSTECIDIKHMCDGTMDCADGSDETICSYTRTEYLSQEQIILRIKRQSQNSQKCILPQYPAHGRYTVSDEPDALPGATYTFVLLSMTCEEGYGVMESDGSVSSKDVHNIICVKGIWAQRIPDCVRLCTLEPDPSVRYMCRVRGANFFKLCDRFVPHGTWVDPQCNTPIYYTHKSLLYMSCQNGLWNYIARCEPDCGRITPEGVGLIINGTTAKRGELPWHVGVYTKTKRPYQQICGGSLVSSNVVISAAHCFWSDVKKQHPAIDYAVAVGKLYRQWNSRHDQESQESDVRTIMIPERFQGSGSTLQGDLALLILVTPIVYKIHVKPICLNFEINLDRLQLRSGNIGKVGGWGLTGPNGASSEVLKVVDLPYVDYITCLYTVPKSFQQFITVDKFCAGYTNGTAVCQGDSGSGLAFATIDHYTERYYLRGVVSAAPVDSSKSCNNENYATFTRIVDYADFIKDAIQKRLKPVGIPLYIDTADSAQINEPYVDKESQPIEVRPPNKRNIREIIPWYVDIYNDDFSKPACSGTIITAQVVITSAYCMDDANSTGRNLTVIAGKLHRTVINKYNEDLQNSSVAQTSFLGKGIGANINILFFLKLHRPLIFNLYIQPVTLDFNKTLEDLQLQPGSTGKVAGYSEVNDELNYIDYPYVNLDADILNLYSSGKHLPTVDNSIFTGVNAGVDVSPYTAGSGLVFTDKTGGRERHYLRGVLAYQQACQIHTCPYEHYKQKCVSVSEAAFSSETTTTVRACISVRSVPELNRSTDRWRCAMFLKRAIRVRTNKFLTRIKEAYADAESDETTPQPTLPVIDDLSSDTVNGTYADEESDETTQQPSLPVPSNNVEPTAQVLSYTSEIEDLGKATPTAERDPREVTPWFVTIYNGDNLDLLCTGTILAPEVVITSAKCIETQVDLDKNLLVTAGQLYKNIKDQRNVDMQNSTVAYRNSVRMDKTPLSQIPLFLKLDHPFTYNSYIQPVIIDFNETLEDSQLQPGRIGRISGWNPVNDDLEYTDFPYVTIDDDILELYSPDGGLPSVDTTICAGTEEKDLKNLPLFDGGGFVFTDNTGETERHYLRGIMEYYLPCWHHTCPYNNYIFFLRASYYKRAIKYYLKLHSSENKL